MKYSAIIMGLIALTACSPEKAGNRAAGDNTAAVVTAATDTVTTAVAAADTIATKVVTLADSVVVGPSKATISLRAAFPTGRTKTDESIRQWICARVNAQQLWRESPDRIIDAVADSLRELSRYDFEQWQRDNADSIGNDWVLNYEFQWSCVKNADTSGYATFTSAFYQYMGGAHGGTGAIATSFDKITGRPLGRDMFRPEAMTELTRLVKNAIMTDYFETTPDRFQDELLVPVDEFPLPSNPPYLMPDGVHFDYGQYEIAPYSAGMPACVIPYATARPLMRAEALEILSESDKI